MGHVVVVGSINADLHLILDRHIRPGETLLAEGGTMSPGGKGANQALAARFSGAEVVMLGAVGRDPAAGTALALLADSGADLSGVQRVDAPTGLAVVSVDAAGENTVVVVPGANALVGAEMVDGWAGAISDADVIVLQGEIPAEASVRASRLATGRVVVNLAPAIDVPTELIRTADPLIVNEHEAAVALGQVGGDPDAVPRVAVGALREAGVPSVVLTLGADGALVADGAGVVAVPSPAVRAVDTVGAGDAFCGALAARLADGLSLVDAAAYAARFAAYTVRFPGAQSSYPAPGTELPG